MIEALRPLARAYGVQLSYKGVDGRIRRAEEATLLRLLAGLGLHPRTKAEAEALLAEHQAQIAARPLPEFLVIPVDKPVHYPPLAGLEWRVITEAGALIEGRGALPALPLGIHWLEAAQTRIPLLAAPERLPPPERGWGLTLPLWALRGRQAPGLGDLDDLAAWAEAVGAVGGSFVGLNPLHAGFPSDTSAYSPYTPSHRRRWNILASPISGGVRAGPLVDYEAEIPWKLDALRKAHRAEKNLAGLSAWIAEQSQDMRDFALYEALALEHGATWDKWPTELQSGPCDNVKITPEISENIEFFLWAQWRIEQDLAACKARCAAQDVTLYLDLAVGTHPFGAETWADRESFVSDLSLGAPPDAFSPDGQSWGLAPFNPRHLIKTGFAALAETLRAQLRFAGMLRIDHVLGFERAFWVPEDAPGGYVDMPFEAMLAVAKIEAARADAVIVGEDLGNVPNGFRDVLKSHGILGCQLAMFDDLSTPPALPDLRLLSFASHDLPTWRGWRRGADIDARAKLGSIDPAANRRLKSKRKKEVAKFDLSLISTDTAGLHTRLAAQPACLLAVQVETLLEMEDQPNLPGTIDEYPNWRQRLTHDVDAPEVQDALRQTGQIMDAAGRGGPKP